MMWNEAIAGRGADEICSCIKSYLGSLDSDIRRILFRQLFWTKQKLFWNTQVLDRFQQIDHKFLVRGHTYLPNDRDFAHIEKRKKVLEFMSQQIGRRLYVKHVLETPLMLYL